MLIEFSYCGRRFALQNRVQLCHHRAPLRPDFLENFISSPLASSDIENLARLLHNVADMSLLRSLLDCEDEWATWRLTDAAVVRLVAIAIRRGSLHLLEECKDPQFIVGRSQTLASSSDAIPVRHLRVTTSEKNIEPQLTMALPMHRFCNQVLQAQRLVHAAQHGIALCEECA